jgi:hypothetical protein
MTIIIIPNVKKSQTVDKKGAVKMKEPLKIFVSHKTGTHGNAAQVLASILRDLSDEEKLHIFVSPELRAGTPWSEAIHEELKNADILIVLYLAEGENVKMGWCEYEAGFFAGISSASEKIDTKIIPVLKDCAIVQGPLSKYEIIHVNEVGINKLLRTIFDFDDINKKVKPDLFDVKNESRLSEIVENIIDSLKAFMRDTISPRLWLTINDEELEKIRKVGVLSKEDASKIHVRGETEALRDFGIGPKDGVNYGKFYRKSKYKRALDYYMPHLINAIKNISSEEYDNIFIPPIRITDSGFARTLIPAYIEKLPDNRTRFEFFSYKPRPSFNAKTPSDFDHLFNFFVVAWRFRWLIINTTLSDLLNKKDYLTNSNNLEDIKTELKNVSDRISLILLDSLNRGLDFPRKISKIANQFTQNDVELKKLDDIISIPNGLWIKYSKEIFSGIQENDIDKVISGLIELIPINKFCLKIGLNCLISATEKLEDDPRKI